MFRADKAFARAVKGWILRRLISAAFKIAPIYDVLISFCRVCGIACGTEPVHYLKPDQLKFG